MTKKLSTPSPHAKRHGRGASVTMRRREKKELAALAKMPDSAIDTSDIPEIKDWSKAQLGRFYRSLARSRSRLRP